MLIKISANSPVRTHSLQNKHAREFLRGSYLDNFQCFHQVESTTSFQSWSNTKTAYKISCPKRFSWSGFVICFLKSTFRYVNTNIQFFLSFSLWQIIFFYFLLGISCIWIHPIFLIWLLPGQREKGSFTVSNSTWKIGAFWYLLITSIFRFSSHKNDFRAAFAVSANLLN